jgi:hypothetical protein
MIKIRHINIIKVRHLVYCAAALAVMLSPLFVMLAYASDTTPP